jgi:hypothetical protein
MFRLVLILLALGYATAGLRAHSIHQSNGEMEWNAATRKLEVSLTLFVNDLELALIRHTERELRFEKTPPEVLDAQIRQYLAKTFVVSTAADQKAELTWVGRELDADTQKSDEPTVTLFFEVCLPEGLQGSTLQLTLFTELFADQLHLMTFRRGEQKTSWQFKKGDEAKKLDH